MGKNPNEKQKCEMIEKIVEIIDRRSKKNTYLLLSFTSGLYYMKKKSNNFKTKTIIGCCSFFLMILQIHPRKILRNIKYTR